MIRERVNVFGQVRHMEPKEEIEALNIPARHVGIIKEEPVKRWLEGQEEWDKKYRKYALQAIHDREHYEKKFSALIDRARAQGLELVHDERQGPSQYRARRASTVSQHSMISLGEVVSDRRYGKIHHRPRYPVFMFLRRSVRLGGRDAAPKCYCGQAGQRKLSTSLVLHITNMLYAAGVDRLDQEVHLLHCAGNAQNGAKTDNFRCCSCGVRCRRQSYQSAQAVGV